MAEDSLKFSIIVLTYQNFDSLADNIESILKQTYTNYEVIISDDGSPNFNREYVESLYEECDCYRVFSIITREKNVGTVKNFNAAIKASTGDIIIPLSQDDRFYNESVLSKIVQAFSDATVNVCLGLRVIDGMDNVLPNEAQIKIMRDGPKKKLWFRNACGNLYYGAALCYRKKYLQSVGYFDETYKLLEDYPFVMDCIEKEETIQLIEAPTVCYSPDGVSSGKKRTKTSQIMNKDFLRMYERNYLHSNGRINSNVCKKYLQYRMRKKDESCSRFMRYSNIIVDMVIVLSMFYAILTKKKTLDCLFPLLWEFEDIATKVKHLKSNVPKCFIGRIYRASD